MSHEEYSTIFSPSSNSARAPLSIIIGALVASSITNILGFANKVLAIAIRWR